LDFDAIVIGGGHAGIEAALALSRMDFRTLMVTQSLDTIGRMSCNPAVGGLAKGNMVREIDALGGEMGRLIDATMIQFRVLNRSRGPAVQAPRAQADKAAYSALAKKTVELAKNLTCFMDTVVDLEYDTRGTSVTGVVTARGRRFSARVVVLTTGTFLNGKIFIGEYTAPGGRLAEPASYGLDKTLREKGFKVGRLKTGTPARVTRSSLDFTKMEPQFGDDDIVPFSFSKLTVDRKQLPCWITYTSDPTHQILRDNMHRSPLYSGKIVGNGPRYCPSIEDKVVKFPDRERHQIFIEPEGADTEEMYLNGISSSMPEDVQEAFIHSIPGLENAVIVRPGYAVEYDYLDPAQLKPSLESKIIANLFVAGQTNGTSGYEEAAAQGLMAGINASQKLRGEEPLVLTRTEAYIGVLIDDLVTLGTEEPYRMFTSRAEHRLSLRHDSCDRRLTAKGRDLGLVGEEAWNLFQEKTAAIETIKELLHQRKVAAAEASAHPELVPHVGSTFRHALKDPTVTIEVLGGLDPSFVEGRPVEWLRLAELDIKYEGYISKQEAQVERFERMESVLIPEDFDYASLPGISNESRVKFQKVQPRSVGQAGRISGVRTTDVAILLMAVSRRPEKSA
jgi:tRNA uridine 5-carboxymethylaminomethyl modification enzyme